MLRNKTLLALALTAAATMLPTHLQAQSGPPSQRLEGSWMITVSPAGLPPGVPAPPDRDAYVTYARGGGSIGSDRSAPFANPAHGAWEHLYGDTFTHTFVADNFDASGSFTGTLKARLRITLTSADTFVAVGSAELRDAAGNVLLSRCTTARGRRIVPEPLPGQCDSIPSPQ